MRPSLDQDSRPAHSRGDCLPDAAASYFFFLSMTEDLESDLVMSQPWAARFLVASVEPLFVKGKGKPKIAAFISATWL